MEHKTHTLIARSQRYIMWEELSVDHFQNTVTTGNGTKNGSGCFQFPEAVVTSTAKKKAYILPNVVQYKLWLFYRSRKCRVESAVYNCNKLLYRR